MAIGDTATAAGLPVLTGAEDLRNGWTEINRTRDEVGATMLKRRQLDTTNSQVVMIQQAGIGMIAGAAATSISEALTFPIAFKTGTSPILVVSSVGQVAGSFDPPSAGTSGFLTARAINVSASGATVFIERSTNMSATTNYYYSWIAIGEPA